MTPIQKIDKAIALLSNIKGMREFSHATALGYLMAVATDEQADFVLKMATEKVGK